MAPRATLAQRYARAQASRRPLVGGHRGNPAEHPENTLASFRSAIEAGVDIIECDVHMSADGELVVIHDHTLERTTDGTGMVRDLSYAEEHDVGLAVELKQIPIPYPGIEEKVIELMTELGALDLCAVISFQHRSVQRLKQLEPRLQVGLLEGARPIDPVRMLTEAGADLYSPHYGAMDPELVEEIHAAGKAVGVWTVDDAAGVMWCRICKPDSVFTNRPREIGPLLKT